MFVVKKIIILYDRYEPKITSALKRLRKKLYCIFIWKYIVPYHTEQNYLNQGQVNNQQTSLPLIYVYKIEM